MDRRDTVKEILQVCETAKLYKVEAQLDKLKAQLESLSPGLEYVDTLEVIDYVLAVHYVLTHYKIERR